MRKLYVILPILIIYLTSSITPEKPLSAQWLPNAVKITFNSNDGGVAPGAQIYTYGIERSLPDQCLMVKEGFDFLGWAEDADATEPDFTPGQTSATAFGYSDATKAIAKTLYAVWGTQKSDISYDTMYYVSLIGKEFIINHNFLYWSSSTKDASYDWENKFNLTLTPTFLFSALNCAGEGGEKYYSNISPSMSGINRVKVHIDASVDTRASKKSSTEYIYSYGSMYLTLYGLDNYINKTLAASGANSIGVTDKSGLNTRNSIDIYSDDIVITSNSFGTVTIGMNSCNGSGGYSVSGTSYQCAQFAVSFKVLEVELNDGTIYS